MHFILRRVALSVFALCAAATAAAAPPTDDAGWRAWARADLDAVHARIVEAHPGVIDPGNPGFNTWVGQGYEEAQRLLPHVVSYDTALDVLRYYTAGFEDGHLLVSDDIRKDFPILVTGWNVASQDDGYVVAAVMPDWSVPLPPIGAMWTGCDGQTTDAILQETVAPFLHRGGSAHGRAALAGGLWLRRPVAQGLRECTFRTPAGENLRLGVAYQPVDTARFFAALTHSRDGGDRAANDFALDDGVLWVRAGNFNPRSDSGDLQQLDRMIAGLEKVHDVRAIVFDARGNRGGDSGVGSRIFAAATGGLEYDRTGLDTLPRYHAQWRVTDYQVRILDGIIAEQTELHGADSPEVVESTAFRDRMVAALAAGEPWVDQDVGPSITPAQIAARGGRLRRFDAKVALLTDDDCVSACLDFADTVLQVPGVVHVGETTGADSVYMMGGRAPLPSGNHLVMPVKVWRGRMRGDNEPYVPAIAVDLEQDEAGIRRDVLQALVPAAAPAAADSTLRMDSMLPAVAKDGRTLRMSLGEWMQALAVPGVGIAVIDDYRIVATQGYGVATAGGDTAVTADTLFQAASIAKPVTALAVLRQVERGTFALDDDINDILRTWTLPASDAQAGEPVSVRRLLAHTGGITPGGFAGYGRGAPRPTIAQVLAGAAPASNAPARVETRPGTGVAYSGLGYSLLQLALEDRTKQPFATLMHDDVLAPLGMASSTFEVDLPDALAARAASGHIGFGVALDGGWLVNPESAAAGLWSTPADLARLLIDVARAKRGDAGTLVSPATARQMLTPELDDMGLGFIVRGDDPNGLFAHSGGGAGWFAHVEMLAGTGQGIVVMTNADAGQALASLLITQVANAHDWPLPDRLAISPARVDRLFARVDAVADRPVRVDVPAAVLARYVGRYELAPGMVFDITLDAGQLQLQLADQPRFPLFAQSQTGFFLEAVDAKVSFVVDAAGAATALVLHQGGRDQTAPRLP